MQRKPTSYQMPGFQTGCLDTGIAVAERGVLLGGFMGGTNSVCSTQTCGS